MNENMNMENSQVRQNSIKWIMGVLIGLVVILTGYILYDKFLAKEETSNITTNNTTIDTTQTTTETEEDIVKKIFINEYLQNPKSEKLVDYRIDKVKVLTGSEKNEIVKMGYQSTDILAYVTYSVKVNDINTSNWNAGNGDQSSDNWIVNKTAVVSIRDGKLHTVGTGW